MLKIPYIVGNWKMHKGAKEARLYIEELLPLVEGLSAHLFLAVPFTAIASCVEASSQGKIEIGAQNMHDAKEGAFTGEIAASMLKEEKASFVILGHSERRRLFQESLEMVHKKVLAAFREGLRPILCIGETLEEKEAQETKKVLRDQLFSALEGISLEMAKDLIIAYEPVWAIGTGKSATQETVREVHEFLYLLLKERFGEEVAHLIPLLYGGSVNLENVEALSQEEKIDGFLIGGASLNPKNFASIAHQCVKCKELS